MLMPQPMLVTPSVLIRPVSWLATRLGAHSVDGRFMSKVTMRGAEGRLVLPASSVDTAVNTRVLPK